MRFFIMDVFTREKYSGNQLAVVFAEPDLPTEAMQLIAREFNFSETTFIIPERAPLGGRGPVRVRIFTPTRELPFAGHPVLGTALVLRREFPGPPPDRITLNLDVGDIPVDFQKDDQGDLTRGYMRQKPGQFGKSLDARTLAAALSLSPEDFDGDAPALEVSTGVPFLLTRLRSLEAVQRARLNKNACGEVLRDLDAGGLHIHAREAIHAENDIHCRLFAPGMGVDEDPATGSAAGCLAAYIRRVDDRPENESFELRVEQGYEMNRPSLLLTGFDGKEPGPRVGGYAVESARGELV